MMLGGEWQRIFDSSVSEEPSFSIPRPVWDYLFSKGFSSSEQIESLCSSKLSEMRSPELLKDIHIAVDRLEQARKKQENILIYADFDLDGTPGLALLHSGLRALGFENLFYFQPSRINLGYGVHAHIIEEFHEKGVSLVVTVDVGITDVKAIARANELGVDVIVTDHHLSKDELPPALAIVNPNQNDDESGLGHLCGTGVAFYLLLQLKRKLSDSGYEVDSVDFKKMLDLFALGTVTDMVPLVDENRSLVKHGLNELKMTERPGLRALLKELGLLGKSLTSHDIGMRIAPKLNALSRLELGVMPIELLLEEDEHKAEELAKEALKINDQRSKLQRAAEKDALEKAEQQFGKGYVWVFSEEYHKGVIGLVANRLSQTFNCPAFVGAVNLEKGIITGSCRRPEQLDLSLPEVLNACSSSLAKFGGHAPAAGFELELESASLFEQALTTYFASKAATEESEAKMAPIFYHVECRLSDIDSELMKWLDVLQPFGIGFEAPIFRVQDCVVESAKLLKEKHLKLRLSDLKAGTQRDAIWFSVAEDHPARSLVDHPGRTIDCIAEPQWNYFAGRKNIQLQLKDLKLL